MSKRVRLPGADELFRPTEAPADLAAPSPPTQAAGQAMVLGSAAEPSSRGSSGRVRHDEKITVYVTADELMDLEHTRLSLRRQHGLAIDRGRIVRAAIRLAVESVAADGDDSLLVRRLREQ